MKVRRAGTLSKNANSKSWYHVHILCFGISSSHIADERWSILLHNKRNTIRKTRNTISNCFRVFIYGLLNSSFVISFLFPVPHLFSTKIKHIKHPFLLSYIRIRLASSIGYWLDIEWHWPTEVNSNRLFGSKRRKIWLLVVVSANMLSFHESTLANFTQKDCLLEEFYSGISYNQPYFPHPWWWNG